jgi:hypothetical protein
MRNIKTKKKINNTNNLKEIKSIRTDQNIEGNEENQLKKINQPIVEKRSKSKRGLSKQTSTSKINIVSYIFLLFYFFP